MQNKAQVTSRKGQPDAQISAACQLARLTGLDFLSRLSDVEADELAGHIAAVIRQAANTGYNDGWNEGVRYTTEVQRLTTLPPTMTQH